jgi:glycosyltransferase involved in cell wall biosynthesis
MEVSVIIPVYNAEKYVREAVESALAQPETGEVILIEDGSPDNAIAVCRELEKEHSKVKLFQHPNGENRGAGASRNLGIKNANCEFIAFLDADDFYLRDRFTVPKHLFAQDSKIDGVYEAVGTYFECESSKIFWSSNLITCVRQKVASEDLFEILIAGNFGHFHTNGIVIKKEIFDQTGYFDSPLKIKQDTAMWIKMSLLGKLVSGRILEPVAMRRVHGKNRIFTCDKETKQFYGEILWSILFEWSLKKQIPKKRINTIVKSYTGLILGKNFKKHWWHRRIAQINAIIALAIQNPALLKFHSFWTALAKAFGLSFLIEMNSIKII